VGLPVILTGWVRSLAEAEALQDTGGVRSLVDAEALLQDGAADLIGVGRPLLADPNWADKAMAEM